MSSRILESLGTTEELAEAFSDLQVLNAMLSFEATLARAQARLGIIPANAAAAISKVAVADGFDVSAIVRGARHSATPAISLIEQLRARAGEIDEECAPYVHWGATSQDVVDTALVLVLSRARKILVRDHERLARSLRALSDRHAGTVMLARTLLQAAPPTTFGYKAAGWYGAVHRSWVRLSKAFDEALVLQFGGASGTLASYGEQGLALADELSKELGVAAADAPWHAHRDRLAALVAHCGIYTAALGKMARDIALLMQQEVAEVTEPGGGSSAMPNKRNPASCITALAAATRVPAFVAAFLTGMVQEHERGAGSLQAEWQTLRDVISTTGSGLKAMAEALEGLTVDAERMRANLLATNGTVFSEKVTILTGDRELAATLAKQAQERRKALRDVAGPPLTDAQAASIDSPEDYLGAAEAFRKRLLAT